MSSTFLFIFFFFAQVYCRLRPLKSVESGPCARVTNEKDIVITPPEVSEGCLRPSCRCCAVNVLTKVLFFSDFFFLSACFLYQCSLHYQSGRKAQVSRFVVEDRMFGKRAPFASLSLFTVITVLLTLLTNRWSDTFFFEQVYFADELCYPCSFSS